MKLTSLEITLFAVSVLWSTTTAAGPVASSPNARKAPPPLVTSCSAASPVTSGVFRMQTNSLTAPFPVLCVRRKDDQNWLVIQQRFNGSVDFWRGWQDYKDGFGVVSGGTEFWLGLEKVHVLTASASYQLAVELVDFAGAYRYGEYDSFAVGSEGEQYSLKKLGTFSGDADCLSVHSGLKFSTFDNDNDGFPTWNCATRHYGAWWYDKCYMDGSNLNARYANQVSDQAINCFGFSSQAYRGLKQTRLLIRKLTP